METPELVSTKLTGSEKKTIALLELEKITLSDLDNFDTGERQYLAVVCTQMLQGLKHKERDDFLNKIEPIMPASNKQQIWEYNHQAITDAISRLIEQYGSMPTKNHLAEETGLSRQTISKHLKEYQTHPGYTEQMEQYKMMAPKLMAKVFQYAAKGDIRAARLYLEQLALPINSEAIRLLKAKTTIFKLTIPY
jgi:biotin operon repressor